MVRSSPRPSTVKCGGREQLGQVVDADEEYGDHQRGRDRDGQTSGVHVPQVAVRRHEAGQRRGQEQAVAYEVPAGQRRRRCREAPARGVHPAAQGGRDDGAERRQEGGGQDESDSRGRRHGHEHGRRRLGDGNRRRRRRGEAAPAI
jgi:hypothetical protein